MRPSNPAPSRQRVLTSVSPKIADIVFYERHDSRLPTNAVGSKARKYETPHPKRSEFPDHKLAFIEPDDQEGWEKWWYVADRAAQDDYNYEISYPHSGLKDFPRYSRTYVVPRKTYAAIDKGEADPVHTKAKLIFEKTARTGERQLDNLYVIVTRDYDQVPSLQEQQLHNVKISYPYAGLTDFPRYTRTYTLPKQGYKALAKGSDDPQHEDAKLIRETATEHPDPKLDSLYSQVIRVYDEVATESAQEAFNAKVTYPYAGRKDFKRVTRKYVIPRASFTETALGTADNVYTSAQLISEVTGSFDNPELDSIYQQVVRVFDVLPSEVAQDEFNEQVQRPYAALDTFIRVTREYIVLRTAFAAVPVGTNDSVYADALLIDEKVLQFDNEALQSRYIRVVRVFDYLPDETTQEAYNYEKSHPYRGLNEFPRYTRKYVVLRSAYASLAHGAADPTFTTAVLVSQKMDRFSEPSLDSLYVIATRIYDVIPDLATTAHATVLKGLGFRISRPHGDDDFPQLTWRFPIVRSDFALTEEYAICPIAGYGPLATDVRLLLVNEQLDDDPNSPLVGIVTRVYSKFPGPDLDSILVDSPADVPSQFVLEKTITRERQDNKNDIAPDAVGGDVTAPGGAKLNSKAGPNGESAIVFKKENTIIEVDIANSLVGYELDNETGDLFPVVQELVAAGSGGDALDDDGFYASVRPYNAYWSIKTTRKSTGLVDSRTYQSFVHYTWPAVLESLDFYVIMATSDDGVDYVHRYGHNTEIRSAYSGPCLADITEGWSKEAPTNLGAGPTIMQPRAIDWNFIMSRGSIRATLHPEISLYESTGTNDPRYPYQVIQKTFQATNYIDWPAIITAAFVVTPWRGGYRWKRTRVHAPTTA